MKVSIYTFGLLFLFSCGQSSPSEKNDSDTNQSTPVITQNKDSLSIWYHQYYAALEDTMPRKQVKEKGKLYPVDEALSDTTFFVFREKLRETVRNRDVFGLLDIVDKDIKVSFGGESGFADFVTQWQLDSKSPDTLQIWTILVDILAQGGTFESGKKAFYAPYIFSTWPDTYDAFSYVAISGRGVRTRESDQLNSGIVKTSSFDIVKYLGEGKEEAIGDTPYRWKKVEHLDGKQGYVYGKFVRSPIGFRAGFENKTGKGWQMVFLVAGD